MKTRTNQLADDRLGKYCCVCGEVVKETEQLKTKDLAACSKLCQQLLIFFQGFICGQALGFLARHCGKDKRQQRGENGVADCTGGGAAIGSFTDLDKLIKTEPGVPSPEDKCGIDPAANVLEELLQVTFDQDSDAGKTCGAEDEDADSDDTDFHIGSFEPFDAPAGSSPTVGKVPSVDTSKTTPQQDNANHAAQSFQLHRRSDLWASKKCKTEVPITQVSSKRHDTAFRTKCGDTVGDISISSDNNDATSSGKKKVTCDVCGEKFVETHLYVHMKAKHIEKLATGENDLMFSCSECNKTFDKQTLLNKHLAKKHPGCEKLTKSCTICHKGFSNQIGLSVHMRHVHKTLSPKECDLCQRTFKSCKELSRHKLHDHKLRAHVCHLCGKNFAYGHALKSHLDAHAGVKKHFCEVCGEGFVRMTSLCGHRISAHSKKDDVVHKCEICEASHSTKASLKKHLFEVHFTGPYVVKDYKNQTHVPEDENCQTCKNAEESSSKCSLHSRMDAKQFICSQCGKNFSKAHYLKAHEKQHQEAKFSCDICCKLFTYKCNLKAHRSTHSSDKPFQCTVCSKKFRLKFLLEDHLRTHNRDLLFKCYVCGRGLTRIPNLKRHIRLMHPEVSYKQHTFNINDNN